MALTGPTRQQVLQLMTTRCVTVPGKLLVVLAMPLYCTEKLVTDRHDLY